MSRMLGNGASDFTLASQFCCCSACEELIALELRIARILNPARRLNHVERIGRGHQDLDNEIIGVKRDWREHLIEAPGRELRRDLPLRRGRRRLSRRGRLRVSPRRRQNRRENGDPLNEFILHGERLCSLAARRAVMRANTFGGRFCCRFHLRQDEVKMAGGSVKISRFSRAERPGRWGASLRLSSDASKPVEGRALQGRPIGPSRYDPTRLENDLRTVLPRGPSTRAS